MIIKLHVHVHVYLIYARTYAVCVIILDIVNTYVCVHVCVYSHSTCILALDCRSTYSEIDIIMHTVTGLLPLRSSLWTSPTSHPESLVSHVPCYLVCIHVHVHVSCHLH